MSDDMHMNDANYQIEFRRTGDGLETTGWIKPSSASWIAQAFSLGKGNRITVEWPDGAKVVYTLQECRTSWSPVHYWSR